MMTTKVRVNLANPLELLELPGVGPEQVDMIDAAQLAVILGRAVPGALSEQADFSPSEATAREAPGA